VHYSQISKSEEQDIYELRYRAYIDNGSIDANLSETVVDNYDGAENCKSFIEYIDDQPAGSIRACVYQPSKPHLRIPAMDNYEKEIRHKFGSNTILIEANKFTIGPQYQKCMRALKYKLLRRVFDEALKVNAEFLLGAPRPTQARFYKHLFFEPISGVKQSKINKFKTMLLACPLANARKEIRENPKYHNLRAIGFV